MTPASSARRLAALTLSLVVLAGCVSGPPNDDEGTPGAGDLGDYYVNRAGPIEANATAYSTLLCRDKLMALPFDEATGRRVMDRCNFEVTVFNGPANEISMAVNPKDPLNIVAGAKDYTLSEAPGCSINNVWGGYYHSTDGGLTWGNGMMPGYPGGPEGPLSGNLCNTDPVLVFDGDGNPWYSGLNYRGARNAEEPSTGSGGPVTGSQVYFAKSTDKGATYTEMYFSSVGDNDNVFNDKQWFAIDTATGRMFLTWTDFVTPGGVCPPTGCGQIMFSESLDGTVWTTPVPLFEAGDPQPIEQFSMPVVGPGGSLHVIWLHFGQPQLDDPTTSLATLHYTRGVPQLGLSQLGMGGLAPATVFTPALRLFDIPGAYFGGLEGHGFRSATLPVAGVDAEDCLHIAWAEVVEGSADLQYAKVCDGQVNQIGPIASANTPAHEFMPWLDVAPDGSIHVAYYSDATTRGNATRLDVHHAWSPDGETWTAQRISEVSFDPSFAYHQSDINFVGDYIAIDTSELGASISWADTRHSTSDVYHAVVLKDPHDGAIFQGAPSTVVEEPPYFDQARWRKDLDAQGNETDR